MNSLDLSSCIVLGALHTVVYVSDLNGLDVVAYANMNNHFRRLRLMRVRNEQAPRFSVLCTAKCTCMLPYTYLDLPLIATQPFPVHCWMLSTKPLPKTLTVPTVYLCNVYGGCHQVVWYFSVFVQFLSFVTQV